MKVEIYRHNEQILKFDELKIFFQVLNELSVSSQLSCQTIIEEKGLWMVSNNEVILAAIDEVLTKNPQNVRAPFSLQFGEKISYQIRNVCMYLQCTPFISTSPLSTFFLYGHVLTSPNFFSICCL